MWLSPRIGVFSVGVARTRALLFGVYIRAPDFWKFPSPSTKSHDAPRTAPLTLSRSTDQQEAPWQQQLEHYEGEIFNLRHVSTYTYKHTPITYIYTCVYGCICIHVLTEQPGQTFEFPSKLGPLHANRK